MKIAEAIKEARILRDTEIPDAMLTKFLSDHDGIIWQEVICKYENPQPAEMPAYDADTDPETELMIPAPWDGMYPQYLTMRIDLAHEDIDRYNNEAAAYEEKRRAWANHYNRTHRWAASQQRREPRPRYYDTQILL